jgi:hypothetical protein
MLACRLLGHDLRFRADGETMRWECARGCGEEGSKRYATAEEAQRYAQAFDRRDPAGAGRRPLLSLLPLRLFRRRGGGDREDRRG